MTDVSDRREREEHQQRIDQAAFDASKAAENVALGFLRIRANQPNEASDLLATAARELNRVAAVLSAADAGSGDNAAPLPAIPTHLLDTLDTRWLINVLGGALSIAERIDAARGRTASDAVPLLPGESRGADIAGAISAIMVRLRSKAHGNAGQAFEGMGPDRPPREESAGRREKSTASDATTCPKCGSSDWIKDVNLDSAAAIDIRFATLPQESGRSRLRADFCGDCGYIELYAIYPAELLSDWRARNE
jgi:hypothetical protein